MLYYANNEWVLYPHRVVYTQNGETHEQWALPSKEWWVSFAEKWEHTNIIEFVDVALTAEQIKRFEDLPKEVSEGHREICIDYIINAKFPDGIEHPLRNLQLQKENEQLKAENTLLKAQNKALTDRTDFHEDLIAEMAMVVYS